jgi:exopolysaccharide biosynthesis WecB/TagA/CpsF family protein
MTGVQNAEHKFRLNSFDLLVPDGQPVRWALNWLHSAGLGERVYGPQLMLDTLAMAAMHGLPVYFYGSTRPVLASLVRRVSQLFPELAVAGHEPSAFRSLDESEHKALADRIVASGAAILFVGLGCPRQEVFVYEMRELLPMPSLAVGAAFPMIAGELAQAPPFMQRIGLEWLFRRYLLLSPHYLLLLTRQLAGMKFTTSGIKPTSNLRLG